MILPRCHAATLPADLEPEPDVELQRSNVADACRHNIEVAKSLGCPQVTLQGMTPPSLRGAPSMGHLTKASLAGIVDFSLQKRFP